MSMRRTGEFSDDKQIERLYNMNPKYKRYIRLKNITSLVELHAEQEAINQQCRERQTRNRGKSGRHCRRLQSRSMLLAL